MNFVQILARLFRPHRYTELTLAADSIEFLGEPGGEVEPLKELLRGALNCDPGLRRAYLSRIRYADEQAIRIALCIDTSSDPKDA